MLTEQKRPQLLQDITGQTEAVQFLSAWVKQFKDKGTADAFLLHSKCGGTGKTSLAHALANELGVDFAFEQIDSRRCDVETVRGLRDDLMLAPFNGSRWKVVCVNEADTMSAAAKDSFLSLLEAIPNFRLIVFTTNHVEAFDLVWQSRVKLLELKPHSAAMITRIMQKAVPEDRTVPEAVLSTIAAKAQGNARFALQELEKHLITTPPEDDEVTANVAAIVEDHRVPPTENPATPAPPAVGAGHHNAGWTLRPSSTGRSGFIEIVFPANPGREACAELKAHKFWWSRTNGCWFGPKDKLPAKYKENKTCPTVSSPAKNPSKPAMETRPSASAPIPCAPAPVIPSALPTASAVPSSSTENPAAATLPTTPKAGLVVRKTLGKADRWSVIHTGSNKAIAKAYQNLPSEAEAQRLLNLIQPLADWTQPLPELIKLPGLKEKLINAKETTHVEVPAAVSMLREPVPERPSGEALAVLHDRDGSIVSAPSPQPQSATPFKDSPPPGVVIRLTGAKGEKAISNGNHWKDCIVEEPKPQPKEEPKPCATSPSSAPIDHAAKLRALLRK